MCFLVTEAGSHTDVPDEVSQAIEQRVARRRRRAGYRRQSRPVTANTLPPVHSAELSLASDARSPGMARRFLLATLSSWDREEFVDDGLLLLSELVTNATLHARTEILVLISLHPEWLRLAVTDASPRLPARRHYSEQSTTGRGLSLVGSLAREWGIEQHPDGTKTVWAELRSDGGRPVRGATDEGTVDLSDFPSLEEAGTGTSGARDQDEIPPHLCAAPAA
ncbi:MAG TPA: ATP-binding protein [Acidimicrobiales bacterium]|nr:ATP-binding protein [Acidimicrobiales bacterium]